MGLRTEAADRLIDTMLHAIEEEMTKSEVIVDLFKLQ